MKTSSVELEKEISKLSALINNGAAKPPEGKAKDSPQEANISFSSSFLTEMVDFIKDTLSSISHINFLLTHRFDDPEFRKSAQKTISQDVKKIDSMLNALLNFININTPILKKNTIHLIIDDILEANEKQLHEKNLQIVRKFEEGLPETYIHDEQVKFMINSLVQYLAFTVPRGGTIGFLTRSKMLVKGSGDEKVVTLNTMKERQYVEVLIVSSVKKESLENLEDVSELLSSKDQQTTILLIKLIKELVKKHQGVIEFEVSENDKRTLIVLRLPVERRQVILYEQVSL
jgi:nitrogen-specific signal transduction histidine kinase